MVVAIGLMAALLFELQSSARAHYATAQRALRAYAAVAVEEFGTQIREEIRAAQFSSFMGVAREVERRDISRPLRPEEVVAAISAQDSLCRCAVRPQRGIRFTYADSALMISGTDNVFDASVHRGWRLALQNVLYSAAPDRISGPARPVRAPGLAADNLRLPVVQRAPAVTVIRFGSTEHLVMLEIFSGADGRAVVAYGVSLDAADFLSHVGSRVVRDYPLLPGALRGLSNDSLLSAEIRTPSGQLAFASSDFTMRRPALKTDTPYIAGDTLGAGAGGLVLRIGLRSEAAEALLLGGLPSSRLPIVVVLFVLTIALAATVVVLLRRERDLVRSRADFVSGVSHELRTPLSQIRLLAELLSLGLPRDEDGRRRSAKIIDQEARRLTHLVDNVLQYAATERGVPTVQPVLSDLGAEVERTLQMFSLLIESESARVQMDILPGVYAYLDPGALRQIVLNLLDNALRYGPRGQTLTVVVRSTGEWARLSVRDEGPGIPVAERSRIWRPYYRVGQAGNSTRGGTGLGLAVIHESVRAHGGRVGVTDAAGGGAQFDVDFPIAPVPGNAGAVEPILASGSEETAAWRES